MGSTPSKSQQPHLHAPDAAPPAATSTSITTVSTVRKDTTSRARESNSREQRSSSRVNGEGAPSSRHSSDTQAAVPAPPSVASPHEAHRSRRVSFDKKGNPQPPSSLETSAVAARRPGVRPIALNRSIDSNHLHPTEGLSGSSDPMTTAASTPHDGFASPQQSVSSRPNVSVLRPSSQFLLSPFSSGNHKVSPLPPQARKVSSQRPVAVPRVGESSPLWETAPSSNMHPQPVHHHHHHSTMGGAPNNSVPVTPSSSYSGFANGSIPLQLIDPLEADPPTINGFEFSRAPPHDAEMNEQDALMRQLVEALPPLEAPAAAGGKGGMTAITSITNSNTSRTFTVDSRRTSTSGAAKAPTPTPLRLEWLEGFQFVNVDAATQRKLLPTIAHLPFFAVRCRPTEEDSREDAVMLHHPMYVGSRRSDSDDMTAVGGDMDEASYAARQFQRRLSDEEEHALGHGRRAAPRGVSSASGGIVNTAVEVPIIDFCGALSN